MPKLYNIDGSVKEEIQLPEVFSTPVRADVIKRVVLALQANKRQPYGADDLAGKRTSAHYHGRRRYRFSMMNRSMSRIPRIHGKVGYMAWRARFAPHAVKGRRAHPPKPEKVWSQKVNQKEKRLAIRSALAASSHIELVKKRGHVVNESPIIFTDDIEKITKSKDVSNTFSKIIEKEMKRCSVRKIRAGQGKLRGRRYKTKKGPLVIVSGSCNLSKSAKNILGIEVVTVSKLNAEMLAPGTDVGRALILSKSSLAKLGEKYGR